MRKHILITILCLPLTVAAQHSRCEVKEFIGSDSINPTVVKIELFNTRGQLISEVFNGWHHTEYSGVPDGETSYFYSDSLLVKKSFNSPAGDSTRQEYHYDAGGKLIRRTFFERPAPREGESGEIIFSQWTQLSEFTFTYDRWGRKSIMDATRLHFDPVNLFKWEYDDKGRVIKHEAFINNRLAYRDDYQYYDGGFRSWRVNYDSEGNLRHEADPESSQYAPMIFSVFQLDKEGRTIQEQMLDVKQHSLGRTTTSYDAMGRIARTVYYNADDAPTVTHVYTYK